MDMVRITSAVLSIRSIKVANEEDEIVIFQADQFWA